LGIGAAWHRWRWMGLLPLAFSIGYAVSTAISRYSSWRYDFPADWIFYFYLGVGCAELLSQSALLFGAKKESVFDSNDELGITITTHPFAKATIFALVFLLVGASPWMIEKIASPRYADQSLPSLQAKLSAMANAPSAKEIQDFATQPGKFFQTGRLLYPRYMNGGGGLSSANPSPAFRVRDYPRLGFILLNQKSTPAVFPTRKFTNPAPQAADVIVLGCQQQDYVEARIVAFPDMNILYQGKPLSEPCGPG